MNIAELTKAVDGVLLTKDADMSRSISCGYTCDLLSWVMARGKADMAWVTVQTHKNVIAVASLLDMAAVIIPDSIEAEEPTVTAAADEGIALISSPHNAFDICAKLGAMGLEGA